MPDAPASRPGSLRRNAVANVIGRGASAFLWVLVTPFTLSRLGQERFAMWSLFFVFSGYLATLDLGTSNAAARYVAVTATRRDRTNLVRVLRRSLAIAGTLGIVWCIATMAFRWSLIGAFHVPPALAPEVARGLVVFGCSMLAFSVSTVLIGALIGFQRLDLSNACFVSGLAVHVTLLFTGLAMGGGLVAAAAAMGSGHVVSGLLALWFVRGAVRGLPEGPPSEPVSWRELLGFSGSLQATAVFAFGIQSGKLLLGTLGRLAWVTQFELGFRVANAVWSVPSLIQGAVIPAAAEASAETGTERARVVYEWASRWVFALAGVMLAGLWLVAPALLRLWIGPNHDTSVMVTRSLAVAFAVATLAGPATAVARGVGRPLLETAYFGVAFVINVVGSLWAVPRYGPLGACLALGIAFAVAGIWPLLAMHRVLHVRTVAWLARLAAPRFLVPAAAALLVWRVWPAAELSGPTAALRTLAIQGSAFAGLTLLGSWPTGDAQAIWRLVTQRLTPEARGTGVSFP